MRRLLIVLAVALVAFELVAITGLVAAPSAGLSFSFPDATVAGGLAAAAVIYLSSRPRLRELELTILLGAGISALGFAVTDAPTGVGFLAIPGLGFGEAALVALATGAVLRTGEARRAALETLQAALALALLGFLLRSTADLTASLSPRTYDGAAYLVDEALGGQASFLLLGLRRSFEDLPALAYGATVCFPIGVALVYAALRRARREAGAELLQAVGAAALCGPLLYLLCPIAGPLHLTPEHFRRGSLTLESVLAAPQVLEPSSRAGLISVLGAWGLMMLWRTSRARVPAQVLAGALLVVGPLAAVSLGRHYVVDLLLTVPFTVMIEAALARGLLWSNGARKWPLVAGAALTLGWLLELRHGGVLLGGSRALAWAIAGVTVVLPLALQRRLAAAIEGARVAPTLVERPPAIATELTLPPPRGEGRRLLELVVAAVFLGSSFAALIYGVASCEALGLAFGDCAGSPAVVLATYAGGVSLGSRLGARLDAQGGSRLRIYALCQVSLALWYASSPLLVFPGALRAYLALGVGFEPGDGRLAVLRAAIQALAIMPATLLLGFGTPVFLRGLAPLPSALLPRGFLRAASAVGAVVGALLAGYVLLPRFGIGLATWLAVGVNLLVAFAALQLEKSPSVTLLPGVRGASPAVPLLEAARSPAERQLSLALLAGCGFLGLALAITHTHLLALVAGTAASAFPLMLCGSLAGVGLGSAAVGRALRGREADLAMVASLSLGLAASLLAGVLVWEATPSYFESFVHYSGAAQFQFGQRELVRALAGCLAMVPPATFLGALWPVALAIALRGYGGGAVLAVDRAMALGALGSVAGTLAGRALLLPALGGLRTLQGLAALAGAFGLLALLLVRKGQRRLPLLALGLAIGLAVLQPSSFDWTRLVSGANVHFAGARLDRVVDHSESVSGGLTVVGVAGDPPGAQVVGLFTNGEALGDGDGAREQPPGFALISLLHASGRESALVVGFGTGGATRDARDAGFSRTLVVEPSAGALRLSAAHFERRDRGVLLDATVHVQVAEPRSVLLLREARYDIVAVGLASAWFGGAASVYNREFYALARARLARGGVFQQQLPLGHVSQQDLASILATASAEFPLLWVYASGPRGVLIGCVEDCTPRRETLAALDGNPALQASLAPFEGSASNVLRELVVDPPAVRVVLSRWEQAGASLEELTSTDDNLRLEHTTARGRVARFTSLAENVRTLRTYGVAPISRPR